MVVKKHLVWGPILKSVWRRLLGLVVVASTVSFVYHELGWDHIAVSSLPASIFGIGLSVLMGFKVNSAYDRWWEARRLWGAIVNDSRSLARQILTFPDTEMPHVRSVQQRMVNRQIAFVYATKNHLRKDEIFPEIIPFLEAREVEQLQKEKNVPNALLLNHGRDLRLLAESKAVNPFQQIQVDGRLNTLSDSLGACERIKNTVFPKQYDEHTTLFVTLFSYLLPFFLVEVGYFVVIGTMLIGFFFFAIDRIATSIQNPFENGINDTPMQSICRTIEINLKQMQGVEELPEPVQAVDGALS